MNLPSELDVIQFLNGFTLQIFSILRFLDSGPPLRDIFQVICLGVTDA